MTDDYLFQPKRGKVLATKVAHRKRGHLHITVTKAQFKKLIGVLKIPKKSVIEMRGVKKMGLRDFPTHYFNVMATVLGEHDE